VKASITATAFQLPARAVDCEAEMLVYGLGQMNDFPHLKTPSNAGFRPDFLPLLDTAKRLIDLPENWDSYGASPIDPRLIEYGLSLLNELTPSQTPLPTMVPTSRGGIQLEWHCRDIDLEIRIESLGSLDVSFEDSRTLEEWDGELTTSLEPLHRFLAELSRRA